MFFDVCCTLQAKTCFFAHFCLFIHSFWCRKRVQTKPNRPKTNFKLIWAQHETPRGPMQAKDRHHPSKIAHTLQNKPQKFQQINPKSVQSGNSRNAVHPNCRINTEHRFDLGLALAWTWQTYTHTHIFFFFQSFFVCVVFFLRTAWSMPIIFDHIGIESNKSGFGACVPAMLCHLDLHWACFGGMLLGTC